MAIIKYDASSKRTNYFLILVTGVKSEDAALGVLSSALVNGRLDEGRRYVQELLDSAIAIIDSEQLSSNNLDFVKKRNYRTFYRIMRDILFDFDTLMTYNRLDGPGSLDLKVLKLYRAKIATVRPVGFDTIISGHSLRVVWYRMTESGEIIDENEYNKYMRLVKYDFKTVVDGYVLFGPGPNACCI